MRKLGVLIIVGLLLLAGHSAAEATDSLSDWPSLNYDAAQTGDNVAEHRLTARNVLKLRVRWTAPEANGSYPIVSAGRVYVPIMAHGKVHVRVLDALTGKQRFVVPKDALGGILSAGGNLYLAGHLLQAVDLSTNEKIAQVGAAPASAHGTFLNPLGDSKIVLTGYYSATGLHPYANLYAFAPDLSRLYWKAPSVRAEGTISQDRVLTEIASGGAMYDENSGKRVASQRGLHSDWFAGDILNYAVATPKKGGATLYAFDGTGHKAWSATVGPRLITQGWPHAISPNALYVQTFKPSTGLEALDPESGTRLWRDRLPEAEHIVLANGVLYALSYQLGQPVHLVVLRADTGKVIGAIILGSGYYAFSSANGLIVAAGMVFIRAVGPTGPVLIALGV
ncbi:MAG: PQQ-binding-like beta-propeller repeat protein [Chloroflexota bacterium]|nr:MAG: hypothetical protein DLM70_03530 [Chloroflexota bacterium]